MANEQRPPGSQGTRRRRPPTVIDLPATEVPSEPTMPEPQAETSASPPADPVPPEAAADANAERPPSDPKPLRSEPPPAEPPSPPPEEPTPEPRSPFAF